MNGEQNQSVKDAVCGMQVTPKNAAGKSEYRGEIFYFCSPACKLAFDKEPYRFINKLSHQSKSHA